MHKNPLYDFIKHFSNKEALELTFTHKEDRTGSAYFLCELVPPVRKIKLDGIEYFIQAQHLSFYRYQANNNPHLSQYHFTATLIDNKNQENKLHVYFNGKDQMTTAPEINGAVSDSTQLIEYAINQSFRTVGVIRKVRKATIERLDQAYKSLVATLPRLANPSESFTSTLTQIVSVLKELFLLESSKTYRGLGQMYREMRQQAQLSPTKGVVEGSTDIDDDIVEEPKSLTRRTGPSIEAAVPIDIRSLLGEVSTLLETCAKEADYDVKHMQFNACIDKLMVLDNASRLRNDQMQVEQLYIKTDEIGEQLLTRLLLQHDFSKAMAFKLYLQPISEKFLVIALNTGNSELLDFVITHSEIAMNTLLINDKSLIQHCLEREYRDLKKKSECISVLIKHNASTLMPCPKGLPWAFYLLKGTRNPLRQALLNNLDKTLGVPGYKQKFIEHLELYKMMHSPIASELAFELDTVLQNLKMSQPAHLSRTEQFFTRVNDESVEQLTALFNQSDLEGLGRDPDIINARRQMHAAKTTYTRVLSRLEKLKAERAGVDFTKKIVRICG